MMEATKPHGCLRYREFDQRGGGRNLGLVYAAPPLGLPLAVELQTREARYNITKKHTYVKKYH